MPDLITINKASPPLESALPTTFASQPSFTQKILTFQFQLSQKPGGAQPTKFAGQSGNIITVTGKRARCRITNAGAPARGFADVAIYGLSQSLMNQLVTLGLAVDSISKNNVLISAGAASNQDASAVNVNVSPLSGFPVVFAGTIWFAYADYNSMPEVPLRIQAQVGLSQAVVSSPPTSYSGSTSIVSIFTKFASQLGVPLENNGITGNLSNPYYPGTLMQQIEQAADHAGIRALLVDGSTKLAIMPLAGSRSSLTTIPLISKTTGMIRSPAFASNGYMIVEFIYNPDVFLFGNIQVQSDNVPQANRTWTVYQLNYALDTLTPGGQWKATAFCYPQGLNAPVPPAI